MYSKFFTNRNYTAFCLGGWTKKVLYRPDSVKYPHHGQGVQTLNYVTYERSRSTYPAPVPRGRVGGRYVPGGINAPRGEQVTRMFMEGPFEPAFMLSWLHNVIHSNNTCKNWHNFKFIPNKGNEWLLVVVFLSRSFYASFFYSFAIFNFWQILCSLFLGKSAARM